MGNDILDREKKSIHSALMEHSMFITWKPEYNLGIPIIDEQHRGIVSTINSLHFGMQNQYVSEMLTPIIDMMYDYTHIHFQIEEDFQTRIGYPDAKRHHLLHLELTAELNKTGHKSIFGKDPYAIMNFLKKWWIDHICGEDLQFRNYLVY